MPLVDAYVTDLFGGLRLLAELEPAYILSLLLILHERFLWRLGECCIWR